MPTGAFVPSRIHLDYPEWQTPVIGDTGKVWAWNGTAYAPVSLAFDPVGTASAAIAAHLAASNPHSQYYLASGVSAYGASLIDDADAATARGTLGLGTAAALNVGTSANNIVQLNGSAQLPAVSGALLTNLPATPAAGSNTHVQYNASGVFAGDAGMTYNAAADALTVAGYVVTPAIRVPVNSITPFQVRSAAGTAVFTVDTSSFVATLAGTTNARLTIDSVYSQGAGDTGVALGIYDNTTKYFSFHPNYADGRSTIVMGSPSRAGAFDFYNYRSLGGKGSWDITINTHNGSAVSTERMRITGNSAVADLLISNAKLGIGNTPTALLDIAASTTASASLRIRSGVAPTSPNAGDIYFNGTNFFGYNGSAWKQLDN